MGTYYMGPLKHLKGKAALVRPSMIYGKVLAQFDDKAATLSGNRFPLVDAKEMKEPPTDALGFNWHMFDEQDFCNDLSS